MTKISLVKLGLVICCFLFAGETWEDDRPTVAQVVALDECDPATFNAPTAVGPGFCKNVALGASTKFADLFEKAAHRTPDPNWDFEPDAMTVKKGTVLSAVNQGGEPHTFTEVTKFGGGFIGPPQWRRGDGSRMCRRFFESRGGQNPNPSRQPTPDRRSVERGTSFSVLHPSLDAHES